MLKRVATAVISVVKGFFARESCRAALILLVVLNIDFFPCIWLNKTLLESAQFCQSVLATGAWAGKRVELVRYGKTLDPAAAAWFTEPSLAITGNEYLHDRTLPLWNPYQAFGEPYAADMQSQAFYPLTVLFSLHITPKTYNLFLLCRLFIAGICAYLYMRLFVSFVPALASGIAAMLAGYYVLYISMPHVSVETLMPAALLVGELLLRKPTYRRMCWFAGVFLLVLLGGMPESSLLLFAFVYCYMLFRMAFDPELHRSWVRESLILLAATVAGLCLAAFLLIPLLEFVRHSYNNHDPRNIGGVIPGLEHDVRDVSILTYIFPLIFGYPFAPTLPFNWSGLRNYIGIVALFLVLIAVLCARKRPKCHDRRLAQNTWFFFACTIAVLLKRYGFPAINAVGNLTLFKFVVFWKYEENILSISVAMLCGIAIERILNKEVSMRTLVAALAVPFAIIPISVNISRDILLKEVGPGHVLPELPGLAIGLPVCLLFYLAVGIMTLGRGLWSSASGDDRASKRVALLILILLTGELSLNYIPELYYMFNRLPDVSENPFVGAPYIRWLQTNTRDSYRVFARQWELFPDWASAFQLFDIRDLDALYYRKYLPFVRSFVLSPGQRVADDLQDRFTGAGEYDYAFATPVQKRLLQLSSVRYLVTSLPYVQPSFKLAYDREVKIYRYDDVLPRAALYYRAEVARNEEEVLRKITDPHFDIYHTVLLDATKLTVEQKTDVQSINEGAMRTVQAGTITSYKPLTVEISASLDQSGILVLNDSDYPGWIVSVDQRPGKWFTANYLFRGVLLGRGKHSICFSYRSRTYSLGGAIAILMLVALITCGIAFRRNELFEGSVGTIRRPHRPFGDS